MTSTPAPSIDDLLAHASFVRAVACAAVRGDHDVDDVVQATWLATLERGPSDGRAPRGWLATVARNAARGLRRGETRRRARESLAARPEGVPSTAEIVAKEEVRRKLLEAVLGLDEPYRAAVLLRYYEDLPPREVAERLGVPVETARTRIKRGLQQLRTRLDASWGGDRRAWAVVVAPLAGAGLGATAKAVGAGVLAKAAAAVLAIGLLGTASWFAIDRVARPAAQPDPVELAASDDDDDGPRLRPAHVPTVRGNAVIHGTVRFDPGEGEITVSAARIGGLEMMDQRRMHANPFRTMLSPPLGGDVASTGTAAADGTFRLDGLARGLYFVTARARDGHAFVAVVVLFADARDTEVTLDLRRGPNALAGRVTGADGSPFSGWIYVQRVPNGPMQAATLTWPYGAVPRRLREDGTFRFDHLPAGPVALMMVEPGVRLLRRGAVAIPQEAPLDLVMGGGQTKHGRVVDAGTDGGIAGADVLALVRLRGDMSFFLTRARTNGDGRVEVADLGREIDAIVMAEGYAPAQAGWDADEQEITVRLDRVAAIRGRVLDESGRGLSGIAVHAYSFASGDFGNARNVETTTDATGRYHLQAVPPGEVMVFAHGAGYTSPRLAEVEREGFNPFILTTEAGATLEVNLEVAAAGAVHGRLTGPGGEGLPGVAVAVVGEPWPTLRGPGLRRQGVPHITDAEGRFRIDTVLPGKNLQVAAMAPDGRRVESEQFELTAGTTHTVVLAAGAAQYVDVHVIEEDGTPVGGVRVWLLRVTGNGRQGRMSIGRGIVTDVEGRFRAGPLAAFETAVTVDADAYLDPEPVPLTPAHRAGEKTVEIVLSRGLTIAGRVVGPCGLDLTTATVDLEAKDRGPSVRRSIEAEADGTFRFAVLPERVYRIEASAGFEDHGWRAHAMSDRSDGAVRLELVKGERLRVDRPQTEGTTWTVHIHGPEGEPLGFVSMRRYIRFEGTPWQYSGFGRSPSPIVVRAQAGGTDEVYLEVFAPEDTDRRSLPFGATLVLPGDLPVGGGEHTVTLPPEKHVRGRVLGPGGEGVAGIPVLAFAYFGTHQLPLASHDPHARTRTGADGSFDLGRLGSFAYDLRLELPKRYTPLEPTRVWAGDTDVAIRLRPGVAATITVRTADGDPEAGCLVTLREQASLPGTGGVIQRGRTASDGTIAFSGLDPEARYELMASARNGAGSAGVMGPNSTVGCTRLVPDWSPIDTELTLPGTWTVSGVVVDEQDRPLPFASVAFQVAPSGWSGSRADAEGRFTICHLLRDEVVLRVSPELCDYRAGGTEHTVAAGRTDLRLVARLGAGLRLRLLEDVDPKQVSIRLSRAGQAWGAHFHPSQIRTHDVTIWSLDAEGRYAVYVMSEGKVFHATGLAPGTHVVDVRLAPWRTILVRLDVTGGLPENLDWDHASIQAEGPGWNQHGRRVEADEPTWEIVGVPPGPFAVKARLERWKRQILTPEQRFGQRPPPERIGRPYAAEAADVTTDEVRLTLREVGE